MTDPAQHDIPRPASTPEQVLANLSAERDQLLEALVWTARQLEPIVRATGASEDRAERHEIPAADDIDDVVDGLPYPLSAGEDRRAYHRWLAAHRLPSVIGGIDETPTARARTRAPRGGRAPR